MTLVTSICTTVPLLTASHVATVLMRIACHLCLLALVMSAPSRRANGYLSAYWNFRSTSGRWASLGQHFIRPNIRRLSSVHCGPFHDDSTTISGPIVQENCRAVLTVPNAPRFVVRRLPCWSCRVQHSATAFCPVAVSCYRKIMFGI